METGYQRGKIQDESMLYEHRKHDGTMPIIGVSTFLNPEGDEQMEIELARSDYDEENEQIRRLTDFHERHREQHDCAVAAVKQAALPGENVLPELVSAAESCSLGN